MSSLNLSAPWFIYYAELSELFKEDPEVHLDFDENEKVIKLFVDNDEKADALTKLLPMTKEFGNVVVKINVIPANNENSIAEVFRKAFEGNPAFKDVIVTSSEAGAFGATYILFAKKVVQYYADNLGDPNGNISTLYQDIARDVFGEVAYFCTDTEDIVTEDDVEE